MPLDLLNYQAELTSATRYFWQSRHQANRKQEASGRRDAGNRGAVTAGKNMDSFADFFVKVTRANGLTDATIIQSGRPELTLPGYFRPTKMWDLLILHQDRLIAVLEFKSQVGSFGNNCNIRCEEAIGSAHDFQIAWREGGFGSSIRPFIGWFMMAEDSEESRKSVHAASPHFVVRDEFENVSYLQRYHLLCQKLMRENLYTAATVITSSKTAIATGEFLDIQPDTGHKPFLWQFAAHISAAASH